MIFWGFGGFRGGGQQIHNRRSMVCADFLTPTKGKQKHININKFAGLSRDWVGAENLFMCSFRVIPCGGEKTHKQTAQLGRECRGVSI